mmetsp:Transcript_15586/g.43674  ORF Transcript_15586/g.43674 Transcript_15586/m.43674 type:complete len:201 (-) Transcript_15586:398-1000(-)
MFCIPICMPPMPMPPPAPNIAMMSFFLFWVGGAGAGVGAPNPLLALPKSPKSPKSPKPPCCAGGAAVGDDSKALKALDAGVGAATSKSPRRSGPLSTLGAGETGTDTRAGVGAGAGTRTVGWAGVRTAIGWGAGVEAGGAVWADGVEAPPWLARNSCGVPEAAQRRFSYLSRINVLWKWFCALESSCVGRRSLEAMRCSQ